MNRYPTTCVVLLFAVGVLVAQTAQSPGGKPNSGSIVMVKTPKGLLALRNGVLAR